MSGATSPTPTAAGAGPISTADQALILALRAWADQGADRAWERLAPAWRTRLASVRDRDAATMDQSEAWETLALDHRTSARPDPARVHKSWYVRALRVESRAVRGAVVLHAPERIRRILGRDETDPVSTATADPAAVAWALALWSERLVGDVDPRPDDPLVIVALTQLPTRAQARLAQAVGQVKHAFALRGSSSDPTIDPAVRLTGRDRVRLGFFRRLIGNVDSRLGPLAQADLETLSADPRRLHARLGLVTAGRLLTTCEPYRARWALQHLPYNLARRTRSDPVTALSPRSLIAWETWVLEAAWARLHSEGRLPAPPCGSHSSHSVRSADRPGISHA